MNTTEQIREWKQKILDNNKETGIRHVDGAEYNVNEHTLVKFIETLLSQDRQNLKKAIEGKKKEFLGRDVIEDNEIADRNLAIDDILALPELN